MKEKKRHPSEKGLVKNNAKQRGWQPQSERLEYERSGNVRRANRKKSKGGHDTSLRGPAGDAVAKKDKTGADEGRGAGDSPASFLKGAGAGKSFSAGSCAPSETRFPGQCSPRTEMRATRKPLRHRHFPAPAWLPHTLTASAPNATAPAAAGAAALSAHRPRDPQAVRPRHQQSPPRPSLGWLSCEWCCLTPPSARWRRPGWVRLVSGF